MEGFNVIKGKINVQLLYWVLIFNSFNITIITKIKYVEKSCLKGIGLLFYWLNMSKNIQKI